jgi:hypothetical protein
MSLTKDVWYKVPLLITESFVCLDWLVNVRLRCKKLHD